MSLVLAQKGNGISRNITIYDADEDAIVPGENDRVRVRIGRVGEDDKLTITSGSPTSNGSSVTKGETNVLRIDASDLDFDAGIYTMFVEYFDNADSQEWKTVDRQVFVLEDT